MEITSEVAKLVISNAKIISETSQLINDIDDSLYTYILNRIKNNIDNIVDNEEWWMKDDCFCPMSWTSENNKPQVYYELAWWGSGDVWMLHTSRTDDRGLGLALVIEPSLLKNAAYANKINTFFTEHEQKLSEARLISCYGKKKSYLVFPFKAVSLEDLAASYPDWDDAMAEVIDDAFNRLIDAHSTIDSFVRKLGKQTVCQR